MQINMCCCVHELNLTLLRASDVDSSEINATVIGMAIDSLKV